MLVSEALDILGHKVKDKVTGFSGVATSISFDLYGCIMVTVNPGMDKDGKIGDSHWFDVNRIDFNPKDKKVMLPPKFTESAVTPKDYDHGPAEKPVMSKFKP